MKQTRKFKNVLITGAQKGIGFELTRQLVQRGDDIRVFASAKSEGQELKDLQVKSKQLTFFTMDVTDLSSIQSAVQQVSQQTDSLDLLINNAGVLLEKNTPVLEVSQQSLIHSFQTNVLGPLLVTNGFFKLLAKNKSLVLNMSSLTGSIEETDQRGYASYRISKAALNMLTKVYSVELGDKTTFVAVHPGYLATDLKEKSE